MRTWRVVPVVSSALLVLLATVFALTLQEWTRGEVEANLGLAGDGLRVVAMRPGNSGADGLSAALVELAAEQDLSIAYAASDLTGVVTVLDPHGRFGDGKHDLGGALRQPGAGPSAVLSDGLLETLSLESVLEGGAEVVGSYPASSVTFEQSRPAVVYNVDAVPFDEGYYLIAGGVPLTESVVGRVVDTFGDQGLALVEVSPVEAGELGSTLTGLLASPYGVIVLLFSGIAVINQLVILSIDGALARERWLVLATLGADRTAVRAAAGVHLLRRVLLGGVVGAGCATLLAVGVEGLTRVPTSSRLAAVALSLVLMWILSGVICWCVALREGRWAARAVPS